MKNVMKHSFVFGLALTLLTPAFSWAGVDAAILQQYVGQDTRIPLIKPSWGNFIIHSDRLKKLYLLRNFEPIWVNAEGYPNEMAQALSEILKELRDMASIPVITGMLMSKIFFKRLRKILTLD